MKGGTIINIQIKSGHKGVEQGSGGSSWGVVQGVLQGALFVHGAAVFEQNAKDVSPVKADVRQASSIITVILTKPLRIDLFIEQ